MGSFALIPHHEGVEKQKMVKKACVKFNLISK
jgi:hypothetical protein